MIVFKKIQNNEYLAINKSSNDYIVVDENGKICIENFLSGSISSKSQNYISGLIKNSFFNSSKPTFIEKIPNLINFSITEKCNLECSYCFYSASYKNNKNIIDKSFNGSKSTDELFTEIAEKFPYTKVIITGGEPLMNKDFIKYAKLIKSKGLNVGVLTNGTLISDKIADQILEVELDEVRVSLDGYDKNSHEMTRPRTYDKIIKNIAKLRQRRINVIFSSTITSHNEDKFDHLVEHAHRLGVNFNYSPMVPTGRGKYNKNILPNYKSLAIKVNEIDSSGKSSFFSNEKIDSGRTTCGLAGNSTYINSQGDVYPCNMLKDEEFKLGNLNENSLVEILDGKRANEIRVSVDDIEICKDCDIKYFCGGVCRAAALSTNGTLTSRNEHCGLKYNETVYKLVKSAPRFIHD
ncbi:MULTISPECIES: radical SAM/SPASM domain-containing protein [Vibrio harveyi group]|uniref:radical SAM/SPASM domain-containing protein n=1 Tax=Vibrio harveyi group TaxID=717610 RepID=UPI00042986CE|nr:MULTISPECIES: radical SAM protein [Vibrio harveyi group]HCH6231692.1 radical SAM protein [Vibrio parahaemolyticus]ELI0633322.1 radical SAM protein [Vibrio harveyi]MCG9232963.1 radical SAM protein [Vibrio harveyi]MCG9589153.1 radical SAM protein [Vibrio harveyi]CAH1234192.1 putative Radical SAM domain protein [Vibrio harveyi]